MKKRLSVCIALTVAVSALFSQNIQKPVPEDYSWRVLEKARIAYENGDYGTAVRLAEQAKENRVRESEWALYVLSQALKPDAVQRAGDDIFAVRPVLEQRRSDDAVHVLDSLLGKYSAGYFNNSIVDLERFLSESRQYPEADYLLGTLYGIEGEYAFAEQYLLSAWENSRLLDIPDMKYNILYDLASFAKRRGNLGDYEKYLLLILASDPVYGQPGAEPPFLKAVVKSLENGMDIDKFFMLYRHDFYYGLSAYVQLAEFYYSHGRIDRALSAAVLGALTGFTKIAEAVRAKDSEFAYSGFSPMLEKMNKYEDIVEWSIENDVWESMYIFAEILYAYGQRQTAVDLFRALSMYAPEEYWRQNALKQFIEKT